MYSTRSVALYRTAVTATVLLAVVLALAQARALWSLDTPVSLSYVWPYSDLIFSAYAGVLALILAWKAPLRPDTRTGAITFAVLAVFLALIVVPSGSASLVHEVTFSICYALFAVLLLRLTMIFPRVISVDEIESLGGARENGRTRVRLRELVNGALAFIVAHSSVLWSFGVIALVWTYLFTTRAAYRFYLITPQSPEAHPFIVLAGGGAVFLVFAVLAISFLWTGYRLANTEERQRILWVFLGWALATFWAALGMALMYATAYADLDAVRLVSKYFWPTFYPGVWFAFLTAMAVGILYTGAFDVRPLVSRTTVYGTLGILFIILFAVVESLVSEVVEARLGLPDMVGAAVSGGLVAAIILPLRGGFSRGVDQWLR